jgi:hypothetical protein
MNIDLAILHLGKNNNFYRHDGIKITYWGKCLPDDPDNPDIEPTQAELESAWAQVVADREATEYQKSREKEYPPIGDQLDALFHAGVFPAEMAAKLQAVKDKYPKV